MVTYDLQLSFIVFLSFILPVMFSPIPFFVNDLQSCHFSYVVPVIP